MKAWQVPIITGTLEFLYDVGRGLLDEIRSRREASSDSTELESTALTQEELQKMLKLLKDNPKDSMLQARVDTTYLSDHRSEIRHLLNLKDTYLENYRLAQSKAAKWGPGLVPPIVIHELRDAEANLLLVVAKLIGILQEVTD
jgi:hypothetical protein